MFSTTAPRKNSQPSAAAQCLVQTLWLYFFTVGDIREEFDCCSRDMVYYQSISVLGTIREWRVMYLSFYSKRSYCPFVVELASALSDGVSVRKRRRFDRES